MPKVFYQFLDRDLSANDIKRLKAYLARYKNCAGHMEFEKLLRKKLAKTMAAPKASKALRQKLKKTLAS
jgi:hypothetical protein